MNEHALAFTAEEAERLTGVSRRTLASWHRQGLVTPRYVDESRWLGFKRLYSFRDLVALRTLLVLRETYGIAPEELQRASAFLQAHVQDSWSTLRFWILDHRLSFDDPAANPQPAGRQAGQVTVPLTMQSVADALKGDVESMEARRPDDIGRVVYRHKQAYLAGTRISVDAIRSFHEAGCDTACILRQYPQLHPRDIQAALAHEQRRDRHTA